MSGPGEPVTGPEPERRMRLLGLHHVTLISRDLEATTAFYRDTLGLTGRETFDIEGLTAGLTPKKKITVNIRREDGTVRSFDTIARADTPVEIDYLAHGGVLPAVLRQIIARE